MCLQSRGCRKNHTHRSRGGIWGKVAYLRSQLQIRSIFLPSVGLPRSGPCAFVSSAFNKCEQHHMLSLIYSFFSSFQPKKSLHYYFMNLSWILIKRNFESALRHNLPYIRRRWNKTLCLSLEGFKFVQNFPLFRRWIYRPTTSHSATAVQVQQVLITWTWNLYAGTKACPEQRS